MVQGALVAGAIGPHSDVISALVVLSERCQEVVPFVEEWRAGSCTTAETEAKVQKVVDVMGPTLSKFISAVNATDAWVAERSRSLRDGNAAVTDPTARGDSSPDGDPADRS